MVKIIDPLPRKRTTRSLHRLPDPHTKKIDSVSVTSLADHDLSSGVILTLDGMVVRFRDAKSTSPHVVNLDEWRSRGQVGLAVARYVYAAGTLLAPGTRNGYKKRFNRFLDYLDHRIHSGKPCLDNLADFSTEVIEDYIAFLNNKVTFAKGETNPIKLTGFTKSHSYTLIVDFFSYCRSNPQFSNDIARDISFRRNPWPGNHHEIKRRGTLTLPQLTNIQKACLKEIEQTLEKLEIGYNALSNDSVALPKLNGSKVTPFTDLRVCLKAVAELYPAGLPPRAELRKKYPGLARALCRPYFTISEISEYLYFTARTLVPFAIMLATHTLFNPSTILQLTWGDIQKRHPIYGSDRWRLAGNKPKSKRKQYRSFAATVTNKSSPVVLLRHLERFSSLVRNQISAQYSDSVFIFWQLRGEPFTTYRDYNDGASGDTAWIRGLKSFIRDNALPHFTLANLRSTGSDVADIITGGDLKSQQLLLNHQSAQTTENNYQSVHARARRNERLAEAMGWRDRHIQSNFASDSRGALLEEGNMQAATPGFGCLEPKHSPQDGQRAGRMCSAYGFCPDCPLATVDLRKPNSLVRLRQLRELIATKKNSLHPKRWLHDWQPQLNALDNHWIPQFSHDVVAKASSITLPPLPAVE